MTSSLVGSEMCIRDSWRTMCPLSQREATSAAPVLRTGHPQINAPAPPQSCLLYTSDAADDM
eukprot:5043530-Prorocentrum_lima.AAC.1